MPPPAPPTLMNIDELVEEILRLLPPDDPASLARAALVCKRWYRLVSEPRFRRRFREFHRIPPILGFLCNDSALENRFMACLAPTSSFRPPDASRRNCFVRDARHGRVLLHSTMSRPDRWHNGLVVWDPITNKQQELSEVPCLQLLRRSLNWNGAVLCAATADGTCDHLECHHGHFLVVFVASTLDRMWSCVYSSKDGAWSQLNSTQLACHAVSLGPSALMGNAVYFGTLDVDESILKYDLATHRMSLIGVPSERRDGGMVLTTMEDGGLGFAYVKDSKLHIWSREGGPQGWVQSRVIELKTLLHLSARRASAPIWISAACPTSKVVGFAGSIGVVFVQTVDGHFMINLNSDQAVTKLCRNSGFYGTFPYISFCTPDGSGVR